VASDGAEPIIFDPLAVHFVDCVVSVTHDETHRGEIARRVSDSPEGVPQAVERTAGPVQP
jgi:hypothetical protein